MPVLVMAVQIQFLLEVIASSSNGQLQRIAGANAYCIPSMRWYHFRKWIHLADQQAAHQLNLANTMVSPDYRVASIKPASGYDY